MEGGVPLSEGAGGGRAMMRGGWRAQGQKRAIQHDPMDPMDPQHKRPPRATFLPLPEPEVLALPAPTVEEEPYRLVPVPAAARPRPGDGTDTWSNTYLPARGKAGPTLPNQPNLEAEKDPHAVPLSDAEKKKLRVLAKEFGFGGETLINQYQVCKNTEGFRKLYCGALSNTTSNQMLETYFSQFGAVKSAVVIRDRDTGITKGFGFVTMVESNSTKKALGNMVHVVDNRTIRVVLTFRPQREKGAPSRDGGVGGGGGRCGGYGGPRLEQERALLTDEVAKIEVREGRCYVGPLPDNVSPNILEDHFSKFGLVASSNVNRAANNTSKKSFGVIVFQETQACKRVLQNPRHFVNDHPVEVALSRFCLEMLMSPSTVWAWELSWSLEQEELALHFTQFGAVYRAIHIGNPATGEKKGYGLVDFVEEDTVAKACRGPGKGPYPFTLKGSRAFYGRFLPRELKRDLMYMEDRFGNDLLRQMHQKVPDSGSWGAEPQGVKAAQMKTATCKLPRAMLDVVVGEDGKIVSDIARDSKAKVTLVRGGAHQETAIFHLVGTPDAVKTAQYMMQIKIKEKMAKTQGGMRYNR